MIEKMFPRLNVSKRVEDGLSTIMMVKTYSDYIKITYQDRINS